MHACGECGERAGNTRALGADEGREHPCLPDLDKEPRTSKLLGEEVVLESVAENTRATCADGTDLVASPFYTPRPGFGVVVARNDLC